MTDNNHPITPPLKLVREWQDIWNRATIKDVGTFEFVATQAARWGADQQLKLDIEQVNQAWQKGADQELEACSQWIHGWYGNGSREVVGNLYAARRPKPPSLKEQALDQLGCIKTDLTRCGMGISVDTIRRALESLPE